MQKNCFIGAGGLRRGSSFSLKDEPKIREFYIEIPHYHGKISMLNTEYGVFWKGNTSNADNYQRQKNRGPGT